MDLAVLLTLVDRVWPPGLALIAMWLVNTLTPVVLGRETMRQAFGQRLVDLWFYGLATLVAFWVDMLALSELPGEYTYATQAAVFALVGREIQQALSDIAQRGIRLPLRWQQVLLKEIDEQELERRSKSVARRHAGGRPS